MPSRHSADLSLPVVPAAIPTAARVGLAARGAGMTGMRCDRCEAVTFVVSDAGAGSGGLRADDRPLVGPGLHHSRALVAAKEPMAALSQ